MSNWTQKEPTESGFYWVCDKERIRDPYIIFWDTLLVHMGGIGWWAKAEPPEWDGE